MKIAYVDNLPVGGGLSRFSLLLCKNLIKNHPTLQIDYFVHAENLKHIPEINKISERVTVKVLKTTIPNNLIIGLIKRGIKKIKIDKFFIYNTIIEIEKKINNKYDLAYFPSAHMMQRPKLNIPIVGTLHDFNWHYFFGRQIFSGEFLEMMNVEILKWMNNGLTICSSKDVVDEARKFYPNCNYFPIVIPIAPVILNSSISNERANEILNELNINFPYIIFPGNFFPHKNHLNLFSAFSLLKQRKGFEDFKLILTGINSEQVKRGVAELRGVRLLLKDELNQNYDVIGMGYQPNEIIDVLIKKARILVSPSIYEAICTPAMDAWNFATPTAISDIPPFREHETTWGIKSAFFNPMDPYNIADVLENYLNNYEKALDDGKISKFKMFEYSWDKVAQAYLEVFKKAIV